VITRLCFGDIKSLKTVGRGDLDDGRWDHGCDGKRRAQDVEEWDGESGMTEMS